MCTTIPAENQHMIQMRVHYNIVYWCPLTESMKPPTYKFSTKLQYAVKPQKVYFLLVILLELTVFQRNNHLAPQKPSNSSFDVPLLFFKTVKLQVNELQLLWSSRVYSLASHCPLWLWPYPQKRFSHYQHALMVCNMSRRPIRLLAHSSDSLDSVSPFLLRNVIDSSSVPHTTVYRWISLAENKWPIKQGSFLFSI